MRRAASAGSSESPSRIAASGLVPALRTCAPSGANSRTADSTRSTWASAPKTTTAARSRPSVRIAAMASRTHCAASSRPAAPTLSEASIRKTVAARSVRRTACIPASAQATVVISRHG